VFFKIPTTFSNDISSGDSEEIAESLYPFSAGNGSPVYLFLRWLPAPQG